MIRSTYNPLVRTAEMDILRPVMEADLLVLDDLGSEKTSEWVEETMNLIVNTRYNERRHTIFTSNYEDMPDERRRRARTVPNLKERIGFRIHSRLHEMCEFLEYDGADYRHLPPNGGAEDLLMQWQRRKRPAARRPLPAKPRARSAPSSNTPKARARARLVRRPRGPSTSPSTSHVRTSHVARARRVRTSHVTAAVHSHVST